MSKKVKQQRREQAPKSNKLKMDIIVTAVGVVPTQHFPWYHQILLAILVLLSAYLLYQWLSEGVKGLPLNTKQFKAVKIRLITYSEANSQEQQSEEDF